MARKPRRRSTDNRVGILVSNRGNDYSFPPRRGPHRSARLRSRNNHDTGHSGDHMKKLSGLKGVLGVCLALLTFSAWAQDDTGGGGGDEATTEDTGGSNANGSDRRLYFSPMFSYTFTDSDRAADNAMGGVVSIGKKMTSG